jgi:hypothetical protein
VWHFEEQHSRPPGSYVSFRRAGGIQQFTPRHLTKQACESACAQNEADLVLHPFLIGQINGHIRPKACQYATDKKN